jgi:methionyl aminopeptidase
VRAGAARRIVPGASLREVCAWAEDETRRRGGQPAFPAQTSRNEVAAHYCPTAGEMSRYQHGDLAKIDIGVHVDGWVVDTATTVNVGDVPENRGLVEGAEAALRAALSVARPGVSVRTLSVAIDQAIVGLGLRGLRNLCGHGVGHYVVHGPPPVPNIPMDHPHRLVPDAAIAIEPFVTHGGGVVVEQGKAEVFRLDPGRAVGGVDAALLDALRAFQGLPFARHQVTGFDAEAVDHAIELLRTRGTLSSYAPLVETSGAKVAQAEHTIYVSETGIEVLTL